MFCIASVRVYLRLLGDHWFLLVSHPSRMPCKGFDFRVGVIILRKKEVLLREYHKCCRAFECHLLLLVVACLAIALRLVVLISIAMDKPTPDSIQAILSESPKATLLMLQSQTPTNDANASSFGMPGLRHLLQKDWTV